METKLWAEICEVDMGGRSVRGLGVLASKVGGSIMFGLGVGELGIWAGNGRLGWIKKSEVVDCARSGVIGPRCWGFEARSFWACRRRRVWAFTGFSNKVWAVLGNGLNL